LLTWREISLVRLKKKKEKGGQWLKKEEKLFWDGNCLEKELDRKTVFAKKAFSRMGCLKYHAKGYRKKC
jgi:hypothetical protein